MTSRSDLEARLRAVGGSRDETIDVAGTALALAALDRPGVSLDRYNHHLARIAAATGKRFADLTTEGGGARHHAALTQTIVGEFSYAGDRQSYDNLQNANLMRVIDRQRGLPIALGILYLHAGRAQGWTIDGLNFPGHFLIRLEADGERIIFDPFNDGAAIDPAGMRTLLKSSGGRAAELSPEHYAPSSNRDVLLRLQNNIKIRLLRSEQTEAALTIIDSMLLFAPDRPSLWYEAGMIHSHLGNLRGALRALDHCHDIATDPRLRDEVARMMQSIRSRLN